MPERIPIRTIRSTDRSQGIRTIRRSRQTDGDSFWHQIPAELHQRMEPILATYEAQLAAPYPVGYRSPLVDQATALAAQGRLERQTDNQNCTFVSVANGLRVLEGVTRPEYSLSGLREATRRVSGTPAVALYTDQLRAVLVSGHPFSQFYLPDANQLIHDQPDDLAKVAALLTQYASGRVSLHSWAYSLSSTWDFCGALTGTVLDHQRTVVGFSIPEPGKINFEVVDPLNPIVGAWPFRNALAAKFLTYFPASEAMAENLLGNIVSDPRLLARRQPIRTIQRR